jgi:hypothetical protein
MSAARDGRHLRCQLSSCSTAARLHECTNNREGKASSSAEPYGPGSGSWTATASMPIAHTNHRAVLLLDDTVLVVGGSDGINAVAAAELYRP